MIVTCGGAGAGRWNLSYHYSTVAFKGGSAVFADHEKQIVTSLFFRFRGTHVVCSFFCTMTRRPLEVYRHSIWYRNRTNECEVKQRWSTPNKNRLNNKMVHLIGILHEGYFFVAALLGTSFYPNLLIKTKPLDGFLISWEIYGNDNPFTVDVR